MVMESTLGNQKSAKVPLPLTLEIPQGSETTQKIPVRIRSLSARGAILTSDQVPDDIDLGEVTGRDSVITLPTGELREVRGNLLWVRARGEDGPEVVFGLELSSSNLKVRRALEEQLLAFPADLKNMWDHWDAVYEEYEGFGSDRPVRQESQEAAPVLPRSSVPEVSPTPASDHTFYWVGMGAVLAGLGVYFLAPESYRLFGVILAAYASLTIAGKSLWSLVKKRPRPQE